MSSLRDAAQAALEALESSRVFVTSREKIKHPEGTEWYDERIAALRAALAQQAEPLNLRDPAVQKRLASQWGYVPAAAQAEPVEPVAWNWMLDGLPYGRACYGDPPDADIAKRAATAGRTVRLLYTAPPQRKPLTEEVAALIAQRDALLAEHQQTLALQQRSYEREIQLEVEAEREACAALLEANGMQCGEESLSRLILETNAAAIRARTP